MRIGYMRPKKDEMERKFMYINEGNEIRMWKTRQGFSKMTL